MAMYPCLSLPSLSFPTLTGSLVTFNSQYALPLKSHTVDIDYTGNTISNCFVVNMADDTNISYFQGLLNGTYGFIDLGNKTWYYNPDINAFYAHDLPIILTGYTNGTKAPMICYEYETVPYYANGAYFEGKDKVTAFAVQAGRRLYVKDTSYGTDTVAFKTAMSGVYLIFKLQTPTTPTITEAEFNTLLSVFNISGEAFKIPFDTPIYGGSYDCLTGIVTSNKDSSGGDVSPTYQQTATANCEINLGVNNIWADTGNTTLQYAKFG